MKPDACKLQETRFACTDLENGNLFLLEVRENKNEVVLDHVVKAYTESGGLAPIINPLNRELNPICYLLALVAHHFLHVSKIRVKSLTIRLLIYIYIYMEHLFLMFLDHTQRRTTVGRTPLDE